MYIFLNKYLKTKKWCTVCFEVFLAVNGDVGRSVDNRHDRDDGIPNTP